MASKEYCAHSSWGLRQYLGVGKLAHVSLQLMQVLSRVPLERAEFGFPGMRGPGTSGNGVKGSDIPPSSGFWGATTA